MRVLVVDDEPRYRDYLSAAIGGWGHEVRTAEDGAAAVDEGIRFRPDVLVTDWMLKHHIHGLHVSGVLTSIDPRLQTILITGFDSTELRHDAERGRVLRFLGKPFELDEMRIAVESAGVGADVVAFPVPFGVVRVDASGAIVHINDKAWSMFAETDAGRNAQKLTDLFPPDVAPEVVSPDGNWHVVQPIATEPVTWWANCRSLGDESLCILVPDTDQILKHDTRVRLLIADAMPDSDDWPFDDQVLIVESDPAVARLHAGQLESLGCTAYRADEAELAIRLLEANSRIGIVILDRELPGEDCAVLVERVRKVRPEIKIVGNDGSGDPAVCRALGLDRFLAKPWRVTDLIRVLDPERDAPSD